MKSLMRRILLTATPILVVVIGYAQTIRGTVKDSAGKAVQYATVNIKKTVGGAIVKFTVTDSNGDFVLQLSENISADSFLIEVRSIGYQTAAKNISGFDAPYDFVMTAAFNQLQGVVVQSERPVLRTRGDTLIYKVSEFASPQDRVIGEVIKKMPGITIDADGTIRYDNKPISAVYIGGDNLLDDKYSIATNSIPQGYVSQVQVIQNSQPIKLLQNKVMSEEVALNLEIKKGAKLHLMGQESIGIGTPGKYDADINAMMFKDRYKAINYVKANNTGIDLQQEIISHNRTINQQRIDNAVPAALLSLGAVNSPPLAANRYLFNRSGIININNLVTLKNNVQLKINAYYLRDLQRQEYEQRTNVFLPGDTVNYSETQHNRLSSNIFHTQVTVNINRENYYLNDVLLMDINHSTRQSALQTDKYAVNQALADRAFIFSNELSLLRSFKRHIIQGYSYISRSTEPENRVIDPGYNAALFNNHTAFAQLVQRLNVPSWYTINYIAFKIPARWITQSVRTGFSVQSQMLNSGLSIIQNNNTVTPVDSADNQVSWTKKKLFAEAAFDFPGTILKANLTLPLTYQQISYADNGFLLNKNLQRFYFNPQMNIKYQTDIKNYLSLSYSYRNQLGTIENIYPGYILTDYRTLAANTGNLTEQSSHQASIGFSHSKLLTLFFWSVHAMHTHTLANNISANLVTNNIQKGIVLPYPNSTGSWVFNGSVSKYLFFLRTTITASAQWQNNQSVQFQNNLVLPFTTTSAVLSVRADTKLGDRVALSYQTTSTQTKTHSSAGASGYRVNQWLQQASVHYNPVDQIQIRLSGDHYFTRQRGNPDLSFFFTDASLKFKVNKWKTDFECSALNLLDVKNYSSAYITANTSIASSYTLPGRILMIKVFFRI